MQSIISLCSGIGGLDLAVEKFFDTQLIAHSEINPHALKVMEHRFPDSVSLGDLKSCNLRNFEADILCAGFPCKPVSVANVPDKRIGQDHEQWVFDDIIKLMKTMPALPKGVVLENVQGLQSHNSGETLRHVLRETTKLGYHTAWGVVWARDAGAPHRRARIFLLSYLADSDWKRPQRQGSKPELGKGSKETETTWGRYLGAIKRWENIIGRPPPRADKDMGLNPAFAEWLMGFDEGWVTDIIKSRTQSIDLLGNAVCPQQGLLALQLLQDRFQ